MPWSTKRSWIGIWHWNCQRIKSKLLTSGLMELTKTFVARIVHLNSFRNPQKVSLNTSQTVFFFIAQKFIINRLSNVYRANLESMIKQNSVNKERRHQILLVQIHIYMRSTQNPINIFDTPTIVRYSALLVSMVSLLLLFISKIRLMAYRWMFVVLFICQWNEKQNVIAAVTKLGCFAHFVMLTRISKRQLTATSSSERDSDSIAWNPLIL